MKTTRPPLVGPFPAVLSLSLLLLGATLATARGPEAEPAPKAAQIHGKLDVRTVRDGTQKTTEYLLEVGERQYTLVGDDEILSLLAKQRRKWLTVTGTCDALESKDKKRTLTVTSAADIVAQKPQTVTGVVRVEGSGAKATCAIESASGLVRVEASSDRRKLASFAGKNIECTAQLAADATLRHASMLKDVKRKLLPGERDPKNERQAIAGAWKGTFDVKELPSQSGSARKGKYPFELTVDEKLAKASGKVLGLYDVESVRVRKFRAKTRAIEFDVNYNLPGGGSYTISLEGKFDDAWRRITGTWKSAWVGSGDFAIDYR